MSTTQFDDLFRKYLHDIIEAKQSARHHDHRRHLFTDFLQEAFPIEATELEIEEHVNALEVRGYIDLLFQHLVFEFKRDIDKERADGLRELKTYLTAKARLRPIGVLTDGVQFEVYIIDDGELQCIDKEDLGKLEGNSEQAYRWFDSYLFSARDVIPTPEDIVRRFGSSSAVYMAARSSLREMFDIARVDSTVQVKYNEWDRLLAKVYGERIGAEELFVKHTYLVILSRMIAYVATERHRPPGTDLVGLIDGRAFERLTTNLVEEDFFSWLLVESVVDRARRLLNGLFAHLGQYALTQIGELDLLQRLYQDLIDPVDRHELGEFYTPDWLAELTLREAGYAPGKSLLDPSCGSGTFLFTAIRLLKQAGLEPPAVSRWALDNINGVDVHPVAVLISKINFILALQAFGDFTTLPKPITLPIYMADSLITPDSGTGITPINVGDDENFLITENMAISPKFDQIVDEMKHYAVELNGGSDTNERGFMNWLANQGMHAHVTYWGHNLRLLRKLISEGRDSIWAFVLKNAYRPFFLAKRKFDFVVGNPPWLASRYIKDKQYRAAVRNQVFHYGLLHGDEQHLFTHIELATLFYRHVKTAYLQQDGVIAFVMPRSVITGAKQHRHFREDEPLTKIIDLKEVAVPSERSLKVFGVDSCVLIADMHALSSDVPLLNYAGFLPEKGLGYTEAMQYLARKESSYQPPIDANASEYLPRVLQGATIVPRGLWFATPASGAVDRDRPRLMTDPTVMERAKDAWDDVHVEADVEADFLYATLLSNDLVPFGYRKLSLTVLPLYQYSHQTTKSMLNALSARENGYPGLGRWLKQAEEAWLKGRSTTTSATLEEWLDYHGKLTHQNTSADCRLLYNGSGSHVCACCIDNKTIDFNVNGLLCKGFVVDSGTYGISSTSIDECHFLAAILNAPSVGTAIAPHQTRGAFHGGRHISRRPFEVLPTPIPLFQPELDSHRQLAALSRECHLFVARMEIPLEAEIGRLRQRMRQTLQDKLAEIDGIVRILLNL